MKSTYLLVLATMLSILCGVPAMAVLPDPHTSGKGGGSLAILFLSDAPQMDAQYARELTAAGFSYVMHNYREALSYDFIKKFNLVVIDKYPTRGAEYKVFGQRIVPFLANLQLVWRYAEEGGGVLVYSNQTDGGGGLAGGWNEVMRRWDIQLLQMCVRDHANAFNSFRVYGNNYYCWTDTITPHPATEGVRRFFYPSVNGRFDDCYTAPPLLCGKAWTPLVKGMPTATVFTEVDKTEIEETEHKADTTLVAVREAGKGHLGVFSINPAYTHQLGYTLNGKNSECNYGVLDGLILSKGDTKTPSDTGKLLMNLYRWLAEPSLQAGFGGYKTGEPVVTIPPTPNPDIENFQPLFDPDNVSMPLSWRHRPEVVQRDGAWYVVEIRDPLITGELRFFKGLIGVHSAASDGTGSVADYVTAAKQAGYAMVCFAENFARLTPETWATLVADCAHNTTPDFYCLPGIEILDPAGNHFILAGVETLPKKSWMTPDGTHIRQTAYLNWMMAGHTLIAHRPLAGPLPYERLKHYQALTVFTYRGDKLEEDATAAYNWHQQNASSPHPIVVHEVFSPAEVAVAGKTGYQQILPSDTIEHAVGYFRAGMGSYYDAPSRHILSEGPVVYTFTVNAKDIGPAKTNREQYRVFIGVKSDAPLKEVKLIDGFTVIRRWLPRGNDFQTTVDFHHSHQRAMYLAVEDANGHKALTAGIRNVAKRYVARCTDRQNWLGDNAANYTGTFLPPRMGSFDLRMPVKGTVEGSTLMPDTPGTNMAPKLAFPFISNQLMLTEARVNEKYITALFDKGTTKIGFDGTPSQASEPSTVYDAKMRYWNFTPNAGVRHTVALVEFDITLKRDVEPVNPAGLFPSFGACFGTAYWWMQDGKPVTGTLGKDAVDIPVGGMAGGVVALTPGLQVKDGQFGLAAPADHPATLKQGTRYLARFLFHAPLNCQVNDTFDFNTDTDLWMRALGLAGETPYTLVLTRGKLGKTTYFAPLTAARFGVAGKITKPASIPFPVPLRVTTVNGNWPAGSWREGGAVEYAGVFEGTTWPLLDVSKAGAFYAGNLVTAGNEQLVLELVKWTKDAITVEVHNPTNTPITATVQTPREITNYYALSKKLTVPAGTSIVLRAGGAK
ncbi:MAG: hypothetical protein ACYDBB_22065 [Armatimonadota bacterium]